MYVSPNVGMELLLILEMFAMTETLLISRTAKMTVPVRLMDTTVQVVTVPILLFVPNYAGMALKPTQNLVMTDLTMTLVVPKTVQE